MIKEEAELRESLVEDLFSLSRLLRLRQGSGMTPQQYWLLRHLQDKGPLSTGELAQGLGITTGSATVACKRLEKSGLVVRERQIDDERVVIVALTEQGRAQMNNLRLKKQEALARAVSSVLEQHEQETLQGLIARLLAATDAQDL